MKPASPLSISSIRTFEKLRITFGTGIPWSPLLRGSCLRAYLILAIQLLVLLMPALRITLVSGAVGSGPPHLSGTEPGWSDILGAGTEAGPTRIKAGWCSVAEAATPAALNGVGIVQRPGAQIPADVTLLDDKGQLVRMGRFFGIGPIVLVPVYYHCPDLCPMVLATLAKQLRTLPYQAGRDYQLVVYSIDPRETPVDAAKARNTVEGPHPPQGSQQGWSFLVGKPEALDRLKQALGLRYRYDAVHHEYGHPAVIEVLTAKGRLSRTLAALGSPPKTLKLAMLEASAGTIGTPIDQVFLRCYCFDPSTGGYQLVAFRVMQIAAAFVLTLLVSTIGLLLLLDRSKVEMSGSCHRSTRSFQTGSGLDRRAKEPRRP